MKNHRDEVFKIEVYEVEDQWNVKFTKHMRLILSALNIT